MDYETSRSSFPFSVLASHNSVNPCQKILLEMEFDRVREAIRSIIPRPDYDDGSIGPILVRLAWHACGTYDKVTDSGGSEGATMRFAPESEDEANAGLHVARSFLEPIKVSTILIFARQPFPGFHMAICGLWQELRR